MNQKTAKLIRRHCVETGLSPRDKKREWNQAPRPRRAALRREMKAYLTP